MGTVVVFGNSPRSFKRLAVIIESVRHLLPKPIVIQAGADVNILLNIENECRLFSTVDSVEFRKILEASDVIICHAGVGVTKQVLELGKRPFVIARKSNLQEHIDDHQAEWAEFLNRRNLINRFDTVQELMSKLQSCSYQVDPANIRSFFERKDTKADLYLAIREIVKGK